MHWFGRLLAWDGVLPAVVWAIPVVVQFFVRDHDGLCMMLSIGLPIVALLVRYHVGYSIIEENHCSPWFRKVQVVCLCVGLFILMCLDSLLMLLLSLNLKGNPESEAGVLIGIFVMFYIPYLAFLAVAMYPGEGDRAIRDENRWDFAPTEASGEIDS